MKSSKKSAWAIGPLVVGWLLILGAGTPPLRGQQEAPLTGGERQAVMLLRLVNDVESRYNAKFGRYALLKDLVESGIAREVIDVNAQLQAKRPGLFETPPDLSSPDPVPGYAVSLFPSPDGSRYLASMRPKGADLCKTAFYTDESGIIQQARTLGCK